MPSTNYIQEHSAFARMVQLEDSVYLNVVIPHNDSIALVEEATELVADIYRTTKSLPQPHSLLNYSGDPTIFTVTSYGYLVFADNIVLITAGIEL